MRRKQLTVFFIMLAVYALCAFITYAFFANQLAASAGMPMPKMSMSPVVLGLANAGIVLAVYGLAGLGGYWFARKLGLPGIYSEDGNWRRWFIIPLGLGTACALLLILGDIIFAPINGIGRFPHPGFPLSIIASLSAAIGEEILFRGLIFGLWAFILNWIFKRFNGRMVALWIANIIAALAFAASHMGTAIVLTGASSISEFNPLLIAEIFLLNGILGLVAGERYLKDGLVAASGVHFWADMVWHVVWGLF
jgi:membrane protease YdiL (CAAX protease family)